MAEQPPNKILPYILPAPCYDIFGDYERTATIYQLKVPLCGHIVMANHNGLSSAVLP